MPRNGDSVRPAGAAWRGLGTRVAAVLLAVLPWLSPVAAAAEMPAPLNLRLHSAFTPRAAAPLSASAPSGGRPAHGGVTPRRRNLRTHVLMWSPIAAEALYGARSWWSSGFSGTFRTANEGWFGQDTYTGGADKLGHLYSGYVGTRLLALGFHRWAGNGRDWSVKAAALTMFATLSTVEVMDGFSEHYRFSPEDVVMNGSGAALGALMEEFPQLDNLLAFRLQYWPSQYTTFNPIDDYSGQT